MLTPTAHFRSADRCSTIAVSERADARAADEVVVAVAGVRAEDEDVQRLVFTFGAPLEGDGDDAVGRTTVDAPAWSVLPMVVMLPASWW